MSIINYYNSPTVINWNLDEYGKEVSLLIENETKQIVDGKIPLEGLPDEQYRIQILGYIEINIKGKIDTPDKFKCDYTHGVLYFDQSLNGMNITINKYYSRGQFYISSSRVWTKISDFGIVQETLEDFVESGRVAVDMANDIQGVLDNGEVLKGELNNSMSLASTTKDSLDSSVTDANLINNVLSDPVTGTIAKATTANTDLVNTVVSANVSKNELVEVISNSDIIVRNNDLDEEIAGLVPLDADLLNGQPADYYATESSLAEHEVESTNVHGNNGNISYLENKTLIIKPLEELPLVINIGSQVEFDSYVNTVSDDMSNNTFFKRSLNLSVVVPIPMDRGGVWYLEGHKTEPDHQWQKITSYNNNLYFRIKTSGVWRPWEKVITDKPIPWINATLQNGWAGNLRYRLNGINGLEIAMNITSGILTHGTIVSSIPLNYAPSIPSTIGLYNGSDGVIQGSLIILSSGDIVAMNSSLIAGNKVYYGSTTLPTN